MAATAPALRRTPLFEAAHPGAKLQLNFGASGVDGSAAANAASQPAPTAPPPPELLVVGVTTTGIAATVNGFTAMLDAPALSMTVNVTTTSPAAVANSVAED